MTPNTIFGYAFTSLHTDYTGITIYKNHEKLKNIQITYANAFVHKYGVS